jgi:hypothetical protein
MRLNQGADYLALCLRNRSLPNPRCRHIPQRGLLGPVEHHLLGQCFEITVEEYEVVGTAADVLEYRAMSGSPRLDLNGSPVCCMGTYAGAATQAKLEPEEFYANRLADVPYKLAITSMRAVCPQNSATAAGQVLNKA